MLLLKIKKMQHTDKLLLDSVVSVKKVVFTDKINFTLKILTNP